MGAIDLYPVLLYISSEQQTAIKELFCRHSWFLFLKELSKDDIMHLRETFDANTFPLHTKHDKTYQERQQSEHSDNIPEPRLGLLDTAHVEPERQQSEHSDDIPEPPLGILDTAHVEPERQQSEHSDDIPEPPLGVLDTAHVEPGRQQSEHSDNIPEPQLGFHDTAYVEPERQQSEHSNNIPEPPLGVLDTAHVDQTDITVVQMNTQCSESDNRISIHSKVKTIVEMEIDADNGKSSDKSNCHHKCEEMDNTMGFEAVKIENMSDMDTASEKYLSQELYESNADFIIEEIYKSPVTTCHGNNSDINLQSNNSLPSECQNNNESKFNGAGLSNTGIKEMEFLKYELIANLNQIKDILKHLPISGCIGNTNDMISKYIQVSKLFSTALQEIKMRNRARHEDQTIQGHTPDAPSTVNPLFQYVDPGAYNKLPHSTQMTLSDLMNLRRSDGSMPDPQVPTASKLNERLNSDDAPQNTTQPVVNTSKDTVKHVATPPIPAPTVASTLLANIAQQIKTETNENNENSNSIMSVNISGDLGSQAQEDSSCTNSNSKKKSGKTVKSLLAKGRAKKELYRCSKNFKNSSERDFDIKSECNNNNTAELKITFTEAPFQIKNGVPVFKDDRSVMCPYCPKKFFIEKRCKEHIVNMHPEHAPTYKCYTCQIIYKNRNCLYAHRDQTGHRIIGPSPQIVCELCGKTLSSKGAYSVHMTSVHCEERNFLCEICSQAYKNQSMLQEHKRQVHLFEACICDICNQEFRNRRKMRSHRLRHTNEKKLQCEDCGKRFFDKNPLIAHQRIHTGEKPFKCTICTYACAFKPNLAKHMKVHNKVPSLSGSS